MLGAGPTMKAWAQNSGQGDPGNPDPQETNRGQEERPKTELKPLAEDLAKRCPLTRETCVEGQQVAGRLPKVGAPGAGALV